MSTTPFASDRAARGPLSASSPVAGRSCCQRPILMPGNDVSMSPTIDRMILHDVDDPRAVLSSTTSSVCSKSSHSGEATDILTPLPQPTATKRNSQFRQKSNSGNHKIQLPMTSSPQPLGISELMASPTIDYEFDFHEFNKQHSLNASSYFDLPLSSESSTSPQPFSELSSHSSPPPWTPSESASSSRSGSSRQPRVQNRDGILMPHGTFTSTRRPVVDDSRQELLDSLSSRPSLADSMSAGELESLLKAARSGDQLALHRLGIDGGRRRRQRHSLGASDNVWGSNATCSAMPRSSRSSSSCASACASDDIASRGQDIAPSHSQPPPLSRRKTSSLDPDLFEDVARMTLQSNARGNTRKSTLVTPDKS